jgi:hypothetical protein
VNDCAQTIVGRTTAFCPRVCASLLLLFFAATAQAQSTTVVARAASVSGRAVLAGTGASLSPGYILSPGDRVDTRGGGRVVIELSDGSMVVVSPESVVTLKDFRAAASLRELFEITLGMVRVKINHFAGKPNPYRMNSPTASIAVRGTEFTIQVDAQGATEVTVIEGAVEVSSLADPSQNILLQAGQSFRLIAGNLIPLPGLRGGEERRGEPPPPAPGNNNLAQAHGPGGGHGEPPPNSGYPQPQQQPQPQPAPGKSAAAQPRYADHDRDDTSPRANASTYDRYLAGLGDIGQVPFLLRFNAFSEPHLDSLENPAYATGFHHAEGQVFVLPTFRGSQTLAENQSMLGPGGSLPSDYTISPQLSFFAPAGGFVLGGSGNVSRIGSSSAQPSTGSSNTTFYAGSLVAARRFGANSLGLEIAALKGSGSLSEDTPAYPAYPNPAIRAPGDRQTEYLANSSDVSQTRLTLGYTRDLGHGAQLGVYYRHAFIDAGDQDTLHTLGPFAAGLESTSTLGHSAELGLRLRGRVTPRLFYGFTASWLGVSLADSLTRINTTASHERDRSHRGSAALGVGYSLSRRTILTVDASGGSSINLAARTEDSTNRLLQSAGGSGQFIGMHAAMQHDFTRRFFVSASYLHVWQSSDRTVALYPDRFGNVVQVSDPFFALAPALGASHFSDYGAGWRFTRDLFAQYIYSTNYGFSSATHSLLLRYTFGKDR